MTPGVMQIEVNQQRYVQEGDCLPLINSRVRCNFPKLNIRAMVFRARVTFTLCSCLSRASVLWEVAISPTCLGTFPPPLPGQVTQIELKEAVDQRLCRCTDTSGSGTCTALSLMPRLAEMHQAVLHNHIYIPQIVGSMRTEVVAEGGWLAVEHGA